MRRHILTAAWIVPASILITVLVAWSCSLLRWSDTVRERPYTKTAVPRNQAVYVRYVDRNDESRLPTTFEQWVKTGFGWRASTSHDIRQAAPPDFPGRITKITGLEAGWPFYALNGNIKNVMLRQSPHERPTQDTRYENLLVIDVERGPVELYQDCLPLRPLLFGFTLNVLLYSMVLAIIGLVPQRVRARFRGHRRQCSACGYPVGRSRICSECGAALQCHNRT